MCSRIEEGTDFVECSYISTSFPFQNSYLKDSYCHSLAGSLATGASGDDTKLLHDRATGGCLPRSKGLSLSTGVSRDHVSHTQIYIILYKYNGLYKSIIYNYIYTYFQPNCQLVNAGKGFTFPS